MPVSTSLGCLPTSHYASQPETERRDGEGRGGEGRGGEGRGGEGRGGEGRGGEGRGREGRGGRASRERRRQRDGSIHIH